MRTRALVAAAALTISTAGCEMYWPYFEGGGKAEMFPVSEPVLLMRTNLDDENSQNLRCMRTQLVALQNGLASDYRPAQMRLIWKQWNRAAREHAGGLRVAAFKDIMKLRAAIADLNKDLLEQERVETFSATLQANHQTGECG